MICFQPVRLPCLHYPTLIPLIYTYMMERGQGRRVELTESEDSEDGDDWSEGGECEPALEPSSPLFSPFVTLDSVALCVAHDAASFGFDLKIKAKELSLDFYGCARLINFIRSAVAEAGASEEKPLDASGVSGAAYSCSAGCRNHAKANIPQRSVLLQVL